MDLKSRRLGTIPRKNRYLADKIAALQQARRPSEIMAILNKIYEDGFSDGAQASELGEQF